MSNIYKMYRACRVAPDTGISPRDQVSFYDPGLGTDASATGLTKISRQVQKLLASVTGRGIITNIADCYEFIINHYQPGDRIFLFGFSRGAYTVRSLANLLMLCGVPTKIDGQPLPRFRKAARDVAEEAVITVLEHGAGHPRKEFEDERLELARRFRARYGSDHESGEEDRANVAPYFIGVFDTVAALGRKGLDRVLITAGLVGGASVVGAAIGTVLGVLSGVVAHEMGADGWQVFWTVVAIGAVVGGLVMLHKQRSAVRKTIRDYPHPGDVHSHLAEWKGEHFDRLLSRFVSYARAANAIDENREDFARVPWGNTVDAPDMVDGHERMKQVWFAGNHSDIGGSYPETESRLSDIALQWMIEEATSVPNGLKVGPVFAHMVKVANTGDHGTALHVYPNAGGVQHCEIAGMSDTLDWRVPRPIRRWTRWLGWKPKLRDIQDEAQLHPSVLERFHLTEVPQCARFGAYRPEALRTHQAVRRMYE